MYQEERAKEWINSSVYKTLAKEASLKSIVLLKNEKQILPLNKNIRSIAVIGSDATEARLGGYSGPGNGKINILDGIKEKLGPAANIIYAEGVGRKESHMENHSFFVPVNK
jgi:beta-glucosidase